jgi:hypothetical protein
MFYTIASNGARHPVKFHSLNDGIIALMKRDHVCLIEVVRVIRNGELSTIEYDRSGEARDVIHNYGI